jgi:hypothetical protein
MYYNIIISTIIVLLIISIINYFWLLNRNIGINSIEKFNYFGNINSSKWDNVYFKTYTYIYPKKWSVDKCYSDKCSIDSNLIDEKIEAFHNDLYNIGPVGKNKIIILKNEFNISPLNITSTEQNVISNINNLVMT